MQTAENAAIVKLTEWFTTPAGEYVQAWEQARVDAAVENAFGFHAVQAGLPGFDSLRANRIPFHAYLGPELPPGPLAPHWNAQVLATLEDLPLETQSVDLLTLPHALEYARDPHRVLREAERVLMPEGRLVITGFNPWSLWTLRHRLSRRDWLPECDRLLSIPRLKDWLKLLSFDLDRGHFGCYVPPVSSAKWLRRYAFMEKAGDRWWPVCGAVYVVSAVKRVQGMQMVTATWKRKRRATAARPVTLSRRHTEPPTRE
ncbi:class I SAM-dependent methyltransferase [Verticiella sediminum]|uniref:Class I SAM-dependent methyltransferase n=1 Tax=Verticiella sediminum TaxID=1247510 RepID=A0A556ABX0_9BURK|nr:class I SAM-dependent methyltransferase [Verticiella sediminum]TSH90378.1 class I SAM-dependent methyltransferase [Verticiella sediminum]